jgi:hypothetical protein
MPWMNPEGMVNLIKEVETEDSVVMVEMTPELIEAIGVAVRHGRNLLDGAAYKAIEQRFTLAELEPAAPMYGTCDLAVIRPDEGTLVVTDWKFGVGVRVAAAGNSQLRYYGLGAVLGLTPDQRQHVKKVRLEIVQPRLPDGPAITSEELSLVELLDWAEDLLCAVALAVMPDAPLVPGERQCRWCPAAAECPALREHAEMAVAQSFVDSPPDLPSPETLRNPDLAEILQRAALVKLWLERVEQLAIQRLAAGEDVPGFKLVHGQTRRVWANAEPETVARLIQLGLSLDEITDSKLKSPTQVEKLITKSRRDTLIPLVTRSTPGTVLAPVGDKRPAITAAEGMFPPATFETEEN